MAVIATMAVMGVDMAVTEAATMGVMEGKFMIPRKICAPRAMHESCA